MPVDDQPYFPEKSSTALSQPMDLRALEALATSSDMKSTIQEIGNIHNDEEAQTITANIRTLLENNLLDEVAAASAIHWLGHTLVVSYRALGIDTIEELTKAGAFDDKVLEMTAAVGAIGYSAACESYDDSPTALASQQH